MTKRDLIPRISRWWLLTQAYDFEVEYRAGQRIYPRIKSSLKRITYAKIRRSILLPKDQSAKPYSKTSVYYSKDCATRTIVADIEIWHPLSANSWLFVMSHPTTASIATNPTPKFTT